MIHHSPSFAQLVHEMGKLPGIGPKTAARLAYHLLRTNTGEVGLLREALKRVKENIYECPECFNYTENTHIKNSKITASACHYCRDDNRDESLLCVVEDPGDISKIDSSGQFKGRYHVLHGALSPLDGINPKDLKIQPLIDRVDRGLKGLSRPVKEVILALDADLEGDTTSLYIAKILKNKSVKISRLAHGIPIGGDIDFVDHRTLGRALENRVEL